MKKTKRYLKMSGIALLLSGFVLLATGCPNGDGDYYWGGGVFDPSAPHDGLIQMAPVQGGTFERGRELNPATGSGDTTPVHSITLSGFWMGRYPVTQEQFYEVMGFNPSRFTDAPSTAHEETDSLQRPVEQVSWYDAIVFANRLSIKEDLTPAYEMQTEANTYIWSTDPDDWGAIPAIRDARWDAVRIRPNTTGYRLPTEAQWEFAAKGGNTADSFTFSGSNIVTNVAWTNTNSGNSTRQVGLLQANGLGIYDMSGNVWEWVWDWHGTYTATPAADPSGASGGSHRVIRGGCWGYAALLTRSVYRSGVAPSGRWDFHGFRLVRP